MEEDGSLEARVDCDILDAASSKTSSSGRKFVYTITDISIRGVGAVSYALTESRQRRIWIKRNATSIGVVTSILPSDSSGVSSNDFDGVQL